MAFRDYFRITRDNAKTQEKKVHPSRLIYAGPTREIGAIDQKDRQRVSYDDLEFYGYKDPLVFAACNFLWPQSCLGFGYKVVPEDTKAGKICKRIISLQSFEPSLISVLSHVFIYGDGFQEIIWDGNIIRGFDIFHPKSVKVEWDKYGSITSFKQKIKGALNEEVKFEPRQVAHYRFFRIGDSVRGIGLVEPLVHVLWIKRNIEESIGEMIYKFANPLFHIQKEGATTEEIKELERKIKDINRKDSFVGSERYKINIIGAGRSAPDTRPAIEFIINEICAGLRIPRPILLAAGERVNRATLEYLIRYNEKEIALIQNRISRIVEEQIFQRALDAQGIDEPVPDLVWNPLSTEDETSKSLITERMVKSIISAKNEQLIDFDEAREIIRRILRLEK